MRPLNTDTFFLPQRPYCTLGSLRQQLVYPRTVEEWATRGTDESLLRALREVRLAGLAGSFDLPLVGTHNAFNVVASAMAAVVLGGDPVEVATATGRLEAPRSPGPARVDRAASLAGPRPPRRPR